MQRTNASEQAWRGVNSGVKYLGRGPRIGWGLVKFLPGEELSSHYHNEVEETFYFPHGAPRIVVDGQDIRVCEGDVFRIKPKETHNIINDTPSAVTVVFIKCPHKPRDKVSAE